jgi:hypothetical protein
LAGDRTPKTDDSPTQTPAPMTAPSAPPSDRARAILARLRRPGLDRRFAAAALAPLIGAVATLVLVIPTIAPGVISQAAGDSAEFQTVAWVLGTAHPTGYPSYVILGFIASHLFPFGDPAYRMNLLQAFLGAAAIAGAVALVQVMTRMRWVALATGLLLLIMPTFSTVAVPFPASGMVQSTPVFWRLSTYADPHMFHLALVAAIFLALVVWERRRTSEDPEQNRRADRWLVAAACLYGVALANHSLTMMLAPGIGLFVLAVAPRIVLQWKLILTSAAVLAITAILFWLELPIRAAMHAPLVYAHPDTWNGFMYVVTGQQFGGIPPTIGDDLENKFSLVMNLLSSWLGPLGYVAVFGLATSIIKRPRYFLLSVLGAAMTAGFAAAYANSDLERYFLVPAFVAFTFVGLGIADAISLGVWVADGVRTRFARHEASDGRPAAGNLAAGSLAADETYFDSLRWQAATAVMVEAFVVVAILASSVTLVPTRQSVPAANPGGVSMSDQIYRDAWMRAVLATPEQGGLPANSVIVSNWYDSTTLWYGQKVEGLRPDVYIVDDTMRVPAGDNLGQVWDVIDSYLGQRPVFLLRFTWNCDGMDNLAKFYKLADYSLPNGYSIKQVTAKVGAVVCP